MSLSRCLTLAACLPLALSSPARANPSAPTTDKAEQPFTPENPAPPATPENAPAKSPEKPEDPTTQHREGSSKVADEQDELSADVQQLTLEQTMPKVIELFQEVESIMDEATDWLAEYDTGGRTIAAQTEVVEKIFEATKERQKQQGGQAGGAMMDMMEKMMQESEGQPKEPKKGNQPGNQPGQGQTGDSDTPNDATGTAGNTKSEERRVPKAAGSAGSETPEEFRKALDAYNRGLERKLK